MSLICSRWFFGTMNRFQAQSHLLAPGNNEGAFLIRCSEKDNVGFVLSGKTKVEETEVKEEGEREAFGVCGFKQSEFHFSSKTVSVYLVRKMKYGGRNVLVFQLKSHPRP